MIQAKDLGKKPSETLRRVARYYIDRGGKKRETRRRVTEFLQKCDPEVSTVKWSKMVDYAIGMAQKYEAINIESIPVTKPEMDTIQSIDGKQTQRLAFTLLCLSKYWKIVTGNADYWVNSKESEIMDMANINTSKKRRGMLFRTMAELGLIMLSKRVDNTNVKVNFVEDGEVIMNITDFRNLGWQYLRYCGEPYFVCQNCGLTVKYSDPKKGRKQKFCTVCAAQVAMQQRVNSVMKCRARKAAAKAGTPKQYIVYIHECPNGKRYIGSASTTLTQRWKKGTGYTNNKIFSEDITLFGWNNIKHLAADVTFEADAAKAVVAKYIKLYRTDEAEFGYNRPPVNVPDVEIPDEISFSEVDGTGKLNC